MLDAYSELDRGDTSILETKTENSLRFRVIRTGEGDALIMHGVFGHCCVPREQLADTIAALQEVQKANGIG